MNLVVRASLPDAGTVQYEPGYDYKAQRQVQRQAATPVSAPNAS